MKKYQVGNLIKTKKGDKCVIVDMHDNEAFVFNLSEMEPETIKLTNIKEKIGDANCTTMIIDGKKIVRKQDEDEAKEVNNDETTEVEVEKEKNEESSEENNNSAETFAELVKLFGKAAIELGNILTNVVESDEDDNRK